MAESTTTLELLRSVGTSDVSDALDSMGLQERYVMEPTCALSPQGSASQE